MLIFGALLVIMMIVRPEGLWPAPRRRMELHEDEPDFNPPDEALAGEGGRK
jgi:branched-chain amino acid transport system permease protein